MGRRISQAAKLPESPPTRPFVVELTRANGGIPPIAQPVRPFATQADPADPRLVQGVLEWPTKLTAEPFVVIRTDDGRWYYADIKSARRLEPAGLTVGARVAVLGTEAARPHEITALAFGSGNAAALALAGGGTSFVIKDPATGQFFRFRANSPTVSNLALPMRSRSVWGRAFVVGGFSSE